MRVLILPGWEHTSLQWKEVADLLREKNKVDTVDFPGFTTAQEDYSTWGVPEYAQWLWENVDVSEYDIVIAHSFGGRVITEIIARHGYQPKKLILTGAPLVHISRKGTLYNMVMPLARAILPEGVKRKVLEKINPDVLAAKEHGNYESFKLVVVYDQRHQLDQIKSDTLLIWGETDDAAPLDIGEYLVRHIKGSELHVFSGVGHNIHIEKPLLLYGKITSFIESA